jgi:hypothetical protein
MPLHHHHCAIRLLGVLWVQDLLKWEPCSWVWGGSLEQACGSELSEEKAVGQFLVLAPTCPWTHGKLLTSLS